MTSSGQINRTKLAKLAGGLIAVSVFLTIVLWPGYHLARLFLDPAIAAWYTQPGRFEQTIGKVSDVQSVGRRPPFCARVTYEYRPPGNVGYYNSAFTADSHCVRLLDPAQSTDDFLNQNPQYRPGSSIVVTYSRDYPSISVLAPGVASGWYFVAFGGVAALVLLIGGAAVCVAGIVVAYLLFGPERGARRKS